MALGVLSNQRSQAFLKHWLKHVILSLSKIPLGSHWLWERKTFHNLLRSTDEQAGFHLPASAGEVGSIPGWRRSPGEAKSDPRHYLSLLFSSSVRSNSTTPQTIAHQAPLSMGFLRQEYWSGLPFPSSGDLPDTGIEVESPAWQVDSLPTEPPWVFLPGKSHGQRRLACFSPWGCRVRYNLVTKEKQHPHTHMHTYFLPQTTLTQASTQYTHSITYMLVTADRPEGP